MGEHTKIQWTHSSGSIWWGCTEVHAGCDKCYARELAVYRGKADAWGGVRYATKGVWNDFKKWQNAAAKAGTIHRVFVGSMMDIFEKNHSLVDWHGNSIPQTLDDLRKRLFEEIIPACPNLIFQLLSKRPGNAAKMVPPSWLARGPVIPVSEHTESLWPKNVITGASVVDQATADVLIPQIAKLPGARFLSVEPLLAPVNLNLMRWVAIPKHRESWPPERVKDFWVIVGGESGRSARACNINWIRDVIRQCREAGVPVFVKQVGSRPCDAYDIKLRDGHGGDWDEWPDDLRVREFPAFEQEVLNCVS